MTTVSPEVPSFLPTMAITEHSETRHLLLGAPHLAAPRKEKEPTKPQPESETLSLRTGLRLVCDEPTFSRLRGQEVRGRGHGTEASG